MAANDTSTPGAIEVFRIVRTLRRYRTALRNLVTNKYASVVGKLPGFYTQVTNIWTLRCTNGVIVRYDPTLDGNPLTKYASCDQSLEEIAPKLSDNVVHFPSDPASYQVGDAGPRLSIFKTDKDGNEAVLFEFSPKIFGRLPASAEAMPGQRPMPIVSVTNEIEFQIEGHIEPDRKTPREIAHSEQFVGRVHGVLAVGWQAIEVYPWLPMEHWDETLAGSWAELDLLAALAQRNFTESSFAQLDGRGHARRNFAALLAEFESLLGGHEEPIHQFLKRNPCLLNPTSIRRWSKEPFGSHVSDFVFLEPSNEYLLVEIESAHRQLFRQDGHPRQELNHAIGQIDDWTQYIQDHKSDIEKRFPGMSTSPRAIVVIGRSAALTDENRHKLTTIMNQRPKLRILTYDDVLMNARTTAEQLLGPLGFETNMEMFFFNRAPMQL